MLEIIGMPKDALLGLCPDSLKRPGNVRLLTGEEILYIAQTLGAYWQYDYEAAGRGRVGLHAELKSGLHSDGFLISRILLKRWNIRKIIADQMVMRFKQLEIPRPDWVAGIPDGATKLGKEVAWLLGAKYAEMKKENGRIVLESRIPASETLLPVEDVCTKGIGFTEAAQDILSRQPMVKVVPYVLAIINRGGLDKILVQGSAFKLVVEIVAAVDHRINDWRPRECPLCKMGSRSIKPKATDKNWHLITTAQL